jgi:cyclic pyranopterin phosphate synthase
MKKMTHTDDSGKASMVDVSKKKDTKRFAVARGRVYAKKETLVQIEDNKIKKGDVLAVARIAGIMAAKRVEELIPLCHNLLIDAIGVDIKINRKESCLDITCSVTSTGKTGVEMEALTGTSIAALTIYDMCKAIDRGITISEIQLIEKRGGKSGHFLKGKDKGRRKKEKNPITE